MKADKENLYTASQPCRQIFVWLLILAAAAFLWYSVYWQIVLGQSVGSHPAPDAVLMIFWMIFGVLMPWWLIRSRLHIRIDSENFYYRFYPFHRRTHTLPLRQIKNIESVKIRPLLQFGGWGIRYGLKGKGYIMSGTRGIKITFHSGRPVYFTTDDPHSAEEAFREISS